MPRDDQAAAAHFLLGCSSKNARSSSADAVARGAVQGERPIAKLATILDRQIFHLRINDRDSAPKGRKGRHELGARYYAMWTKGPKPGLDVSRGFWYAILEWAERERTSSNEFGIALDGYAAVPRAHRWRGDMGGSATRALPRKA